MKKHQLTQTVHTHINCGKCQHKWKTPGILVTHKCPKCGHESKLKNSI